MTDSAEDREYAISKSLSTVQAQKKSLALL